MKLYIAGPMKGYPSHNWPAFDEEARLLREAGYEVVTPTEVNGTYEEAAKLAYETCLRNDLKAMLECDAVATLPGYTQSFGATLECHIANCLKMEVRSAVEWRNPIAINLFGDVG